MTGYKAGKLGLPLSKILRGQKNADNVNSKKINIKVISEFSNELYISVEEVRELVRNGMYVGSHGSMHYWLDKLTAEEQERDIKQPLKFLDSVGASTKDWVMCYPYGAHNDDTIELLKSFEAVLGITTEVRVASLTSDNPFKLPRLDTNDFPQ